MYSSDVRVGLYIYNKYIDEVLI